MITRIIPLEEVKLLFTEITLNKTGKVTKVSDQSTFNGIAYGVSKLFQKGMKDVALIESHLFPDSAFGTHLDTVASNLGVADRFGASQSGTYVRVFGDEGTTYVAGVNVFKGQGKTFDIIDDFTIGPEGYGYIKVRSSQSGLQANIPSLTINEVSPVPPGHTSVTNEYHATGGRDVESDEVFRVRIKKGATIGSSNTLDYITQVFMKFNSDIFRVYNYGSNNQNQTVLGIVTQNGVDLTTNELSQLLDDVKEYLSFTDYNNITNLSIGVELRNVEYDPIDIEFRCSLIQNASFEEVRKKIQTDISKYFDFRFWKPTQKVEWDDLLEIVKSNPLIDLVADSYFVPRSDMKVRLDRLPRVRSFKMLDLDGNLIIDNENVLDPIYYPELINPSIQSVL